MIALCAQHHRKADGGSFTVGQLHELKTNRANADLVRGELDWLRRDLLAIVGGNYYYETPRIVVIDEHEVVVLNRDEEGYLRLNACLPSLSPDTRMKIINSSWDNIGEPTDLRSPPQGKELEIKYANGDFFYLRFTEFLNVSDLCEKYGEGLRQREAKMSFPLTVLEIQLDITGSGISLTPKKSTFGGLTMKDCFSFKCGGGINYQTGFKWGG